MAENLQLKYLYRGGDGKTKIGWVIFKGMPEKQTPKTQTPEGFEADIRRKFDGGEYFIAKQLKLPELFPFIVPVDGEIPELGKDSVHHGWHEILEFKPTDRKPTDPRTPEEFRREVNAVKDWEYRHADKINAQAIHDHIARKKMRSGPSLEI